MEKSSLNFEQFLHTIQFIDLYNTICVTINDSWGTCEIYSETFQFGIYLERHMKSSTKPDG